jgi:DNA gyrase subunit A
MVTRKGLTKKTLLTAYSRPKKGGIIGISLNDDDSLIASLLVKEADDVVLSTRSGMAIRFSESQSRAMGRDTQGVKGIELVDGDEVVGAVVVDPQGSLLTVCERGYGKRTVFEEYRSQNRGGKGLIDIKTTDRNGQVVAVAAVRDDDEVMLISQDGMVVRIKVAQVSTIGRNTQGVRVMSLSDEDRVVALAKIAKEDVDEFAAPADAAPSVNGAHPPASPPEDSAPDETASPEDEPDSA